MPLNIQEYTHQMDYVKIALYGESGTGKTRFCSTAESPLFISSEMKFKSVRRDRVPYIAVQTIADLNVELSALSMNVQSCPYRTICIDSFTDIAERTLKTLTKMLMTRAPESLRVCALLDKPSRRKVDFEGDYVGFSIPDEFVVGYGLDYAEQYRNLPEVCIYRPDGE